MVAAGALVLCGAAAYFSFPRYTATEEFRILWSLGWGVLLAGCAVFSLRRTRRRISVAVVSSVLSTLIGALLTALVMMVSAAPSGELLENVPVMVATMALLTLVSSPVFVAIGLAFGAIVGLLVFLVDRYPS